MQKIVGQVSQAGVGAGLSAAQWGLSAGCQYSGQSRHSNGRARLDSSLGGRALIGGSLTAEFLVLGTCRHCRGVRRGTGGGDAADAVFRMDAEAHPDLAAWAVGWGADHHNRGAAWQPKFIDTRL